MWQLKTALKDAISFVFYLFLFLVPAQKNAVLVYHSVDHVDPELDPWRMSLTPARFESHLKFLSRYKCAFKITFDDGYKNNFTKAQPLLVKYGLKAVIFITTDYIDGKLSSKKIWGISKEILPLSWGDLKTLLSSGFEIGSHGKTHRSLAALSEKEARKEVNDSKKRIEEMLSIAIDSFSYPTGAKGTFNSRTRQILEQNGFKYAYTNIMGLNPLPLKDRLAIKRIRINSEDNVFRLKMKMAGAYDWVDRFRKEVS